MNEELRGELPTSSITRRITVTHRHYFALDFLFPFHFFGSAASPAVVLLRARFIVRFFFARAYAFGSAPIGASRGARLGLSSLPSLRLRRLMPFSPV